MKTMLPLLILLALAGTEILFIRRQLLAQTSAGQMSVAIAQKKIRYHVAGWIGLMLIYATYGFGQFFNLL